MFYIDFYVFYSVLGRTPIYPNSRNSRRPAIVVESPRINFKTFL